MGDESVDNLTTYLFSLYLADLIEYGIVNEAEWKRLINKDDE